MKTLKETSPSLVAKIGDNIYYASATSEKRGGIMFNYNGTDYSLYNRDDVEYELIHWLSGADALVDGVWRDRVAIGGAMDFVNNGCVWNDEHNGYYSADGHAQYFVTAETPILDFGTDWFVEITARVGEPLGTSCGLVDLASLGAVDNGKAGDGIFIIKNNRFGAPSGQIEVNTKVHWGGSGTKWVNTGSATYTWNDKTLFVFGSNRYSINQSRAFITWNGNRYYGAPYYTGVWNKWSMQFYLFRGRAQSSITEEFQAIFQCGPTTIYDIKVWRKKS